MTRTDGALCCRRELLPSKYTMMPAVHMDGTQCGCWVVEARRQTKERERDGQPVYCPAHGREKPEKGTLETVRALKDVHKTGGRLVHQVPVWSELASSGKLQGRNKKGKFKKGRDLKVDIVVERCHGALEGSNPDDVVGVEVDGPGHKTKKAKWQDGKKNVTVPWRIHRVPVSKMEDADDFEAEAYKAVSQWGG